MSEDTAKLIVKINFLVLALVVTMMVMSGMKNRGLSESFRNIMGFQQHAQSEPIRAGRQ